MYTHDGDPLCAATGVEVHAQAGIDDLIVSANICQTQSEQLEGMQRLAEDVMSHFVARPVRPSVADVA
ncbi:MAG: hypothetical protein OET44_13435 [Gammaproteobacteria bacterium]|nr:hypothetical protein [Gammaproteobacteria bacterium]